MKNFITYFIISILCVSCSDFLDIKPDKQLSTPSTLKDIEAILNRVEQMNIGIVPDLLEFSGDNYFLPYTDYQAISVVEYRGMYLWDSTPVFSPSWVGGYTAIFYANTALDELNKIQTINQNEENLKNELKGRAHFYRGFTFLKLVQTFGSSYSPLNFEKPGIVLRLTSNINDESKRSSLKESYDQVISDLLTSSELLTNSSTYKTQPNKAAAYAGLAQAYFSMLDYNKAAEYAKLCLDIYKDILDFNTLSGTSQYPFSRYNSDVIFYCTMGSSPIPARLKVSRDLLESYEENDLRKTLFYASIAGGEFNFKGNYAQNNSGFFAGITVGDMMLITAESAARKGNYVEAKNILETHLARRYKLGKSPRLDDIEPTYLLEFVILERRKEMAFKGYRWQDLRRLSSEPLFSKDLIRKFNGDVSAKLSSEALFNYAHLIPNIVMEKVNFSQNQN